MKEFKQSIYPELFELGAQRTLEGILDEESYAVGDIFIQTPSGISYNLTLTNTGEAILLQGTVTAAAHTQCARCLEDAKLEIEGEVEGYFLLESTNEPEGYEEDEFEIIDSDGNFDISSSLLAALVDATPFVVFCKEDCKGLCPQCGQNLNEGACSCAQEPDPLNPFSVLANLKFDETEE